MLKDHLLTAIRDIEAEKNSQLAMLKERVTREKIIPYNEKVDELTRNTISALDEKENEEICAIQLKYSEEKKAIISRADANKTSNADLVITQASSELEQKYGNIIDDLKNTLESLGE